jgi:hypothetical protein
LIVNKTTVIYLLPQKQLSFIYCHKNKCHLFIATKTTVSFIYCHKNNSFIYCHKNKCNSMYCHRIDVYKNYFTGCIEKKMWVSYACKNEFNHVLSHMISKKCVTWPAKSYVTWPIQYVIISIYRDSWNRKHPNHQQTKQKVWRSLIMKSNIKV